jgi:hypothetical protein
VAVSSTGTESELREGSLTWLPLSQLHGFVRSLDWRAVLVSRWPPVALLLAVELPAHTVTAPAGELITRERPGAPEVTDGSDTPASHQTTARQ